MAKGNKFDSYYSPEGDEGGESFTREDRFDSEDLHLAGSATVDSAKARHIRISGSGHVAGSMVGETVVCSGSIHVGGSMKASSIRVSGSMHCDGPISSESFSVSGSGTAKSVYGEKELKVAGSIRADRLASRGRIKVAGGVDADEVVSATVELDGGGRVGAVSCTDADINVNASGGKLISLFGKRRRMKLEIESIAASGRVRIDECTVGEISADSVFIGRHCSAGTVKYRSKCDVENGAVLSSQPVKE